MASRFLTANFDNTQTSIESNPQNEDNLINDYINLIIENKNNSRFVRNATYRDVGGNNNMPNIKIMNNFQRYGPDGNEQPIFIPTTTTSRVLGPIQEIDLNAFNAAIGAAGSGIPAGGTVGLGSTFVPSGASSNIGIGSTAAPAPLAAIAAPAASNLAAPAAAPASNLAQPQSFTNREAFQNYYTNYINGGFKEYYHI
jgi:hypothetical protein